MIVTTGNGSALAARSASTTIPLVFLSQGDPVQFGLVESLSRPGGNATGVALLSSDLVAKRLGLVRQLAPAMSLIAFLVNPTAPETEPQLKEVEEAAHSIGQQIRILKNLDQRRICVGKPANFVLGCRWRARLRTCPQKTRALRKSSSTAHVTQGRP